MNSIRNLLDIGYKGEIDLKLSNVCKIYSGNKNRERVRALNNINLEFEAKGMVVLLGVSGTGKTTLLNILAGLDDVTEGEIQYGMDNLNQFTQKQWDEFRLRDVGFVFQESNLITDLSVFENLALPLKMMGEEKSKIKDRVRKMLSMVGLEGYEKRKSSELSAGQRQRLAIARGMIKEPKMLLLDEPTGNLDIKNSQMVFELLNELKKDCFIVVASHDEVNTNRFADRIIVLKDGEVIEDRINKIEGSRTIKGIRIYNRTLNQEEELDIYSSENIVNYLRRIVLSQMQDEIGENMSYDLGVKIELGEMKKEVRDEHCGEEQIVKKSVGLSMGDIGRFALHGLKNRKVRLCITTIVFSLTISLIFLVSHMYGYDYKEIMCDYLKESAVSTVQVHRERKYTGIFGEEIGVEVYSGKNMLGDIYDFYDDTAVGKVIYFEQVKYVEDEEEYSYWNLPVIIGDNLIDRYEWIGTYPKEYNEIMITDYVLNDIFPGENISEIIGCELIYEGITFHVSGVINTRYKEMDFQDADGGEEYRYAICGDELIKFCQNEIKYLKIKASNILQRNALIPYIESKMKYGAVSMLGNEDIIWGRMPESANEIVISKMIAYEMGYDVESGEGALQQNIRLKDLHDEKYGQTFDFINMYSYFPDGMQVVGIYDTYSGEKIIEADVLICDEKFKKVMEEYYRYYCYDETRIYVEDTDLLVKGCADNDILIDEEGCIYIYRFNDFLKSISSVSAVLLGILVLITLFLFVSLISYSIKDQSRKIGIMRTMGVPLKNIVSVFIVEVLLIVSISNIIGFCIFQGILGKIVDIYYKYMINVELDIMHIDIAITLVTMATIYVISLIAVYTPIRKMALEKPINLLKR